MTVDEPRTEDNAPVPIPAPDSKPMELKREREDDDESAADAPAKKAPRIKATVTTRGSKSAGKAQIGRKTRNATSNGTMVKGSPTKSSDGSQRITNFFNT